MDSVQRFINDNQHQLGYIMDEASRKWIENDSVGALTVGDCNFVVEKYGQYYELLDKIEQLEKEVGEAYGNGYRDGADDILSSI